MKDIKGIQQEKTFMYEDVGTLLTIYISKLL